MQTRDRIIKAAYELAAERPFDKISFADVAKIAGVHWTAVRRHFSSKQDMQQVLAEWQLDNGHAFVDTRTRILDAAASVFAKHGYSGASLDHVAADAGLTKGAVYWHFSSKQDLFLALCDRNLTKQLNVVPSQAKDILASSEPMEALALWLQSQIACCGQNANQPMLFFEFITSSREPAVKEKLRETYAKIFDGTGMVLKEMQDGGYLSRDVDPQVLAVMFHAIINGLLLTWLIDPDRVPFDSMSSEVSRILWEGLNPKKA